MKGNGRSLRLKLIKGGGMNGMGPGVTMEGVRIEVTSLPIKVFREKLYPGEKLRYSINYGGSSR